MSRSSVNELLVVCIIVLACLKFTSGVEQKLDVGLYDESYYLYNGVTLSFSNIPAANNAPLYSLWYYVLSFIEPDRIDLYFLNFKLMAILPPLFIYVLLRAKGVPLLLSSVITLLFLISQANLPTWPKVSHFALLIMLIALTLISRIANNLAATAAAMVSALLMAYVRPEYFLSFSIFALAVVVLYIRTHNRFSRLNTGVFISAMIISTALIGALGAPLSGGRSIFAFGQHFSLNWVSWTGSDLNPWTNWQEIVNRNFGPVQSVSEAFVSDPALFIRHLAVNSVKIFRPFPAIFFYHTNIILPPTKMFGLVEAFFVFALGAFFIIKSWPKKIKAAVANNKRFLLMSGAYAFTGLVSAIVIYPRDHYVLLPVMLMVLSIAVVFTTQQQQPTPAFAWPKQLAIILLCGVLVLLAIPRYVDKVSPLRENLATIQAIKALQIEERVTMLEAQGGFNIYAGDNFRRMREFEKNAPFDRFLAEQNIGVIVLSDLVKDDPRFKHDSEWQSFLRHYQEKGFTPIPVPNSTRTLFVRNDLMGHTSIDQ
ncbi:MAG: hypothetical protein MI924_39405 [Chloroflexales bacterium]|nr:hypothetical protein [Chloroflexales bacterium]